MKMKKLLCLLCLVLTPVIICLADHSIAESQNSARQQHENYKEVSGITREKTDFTSEFAATPERLQKYYLADAVSQRTAKTSSDKNTSTFQEIADEIKTLEEVFPYLLVFVALLLAGLCAVLFLFFKNRQINKNLEKLVSERTNELAVQTSTLTTIFEAIPDLLFCKNLDLCFTRCNRSFEEFFGCREEDILGRDDINGIKMSLELAEQFRAGDRKAIAERRMNVSEEKIVSANGKLRLFETVKTPLMHGDTVTGIMGISRDITQRKTAEETLQLTLDNLHTCIYINEIETGKILFINENMAKEFGGGDFNGRVCWEVLQKDFTEQCDFCPIPKLLASGDEHYVWEEHNTVTGKYYRNTDNLITWHDGRIVHMQHSVDITDSVKLQQDLEHASKAKGDFLSRMSHEIRTPLNAIIGMTDIAMHSDELGKIKYCLDKVENASKHLLGVINDILDMSKIEADKFELYSTEFNFEKMLINITNVINFRIEEKHQEFVVNLHGDVPTFIIGDELRLSQVLTNLLTNAVKFTPEKGIIILGIEKIGETDDEVSLRIEVADNGIGISEEQQRRLFSSFEQADGSISRKFGGTGLGLAISKRIVELMDGMVWIESELGQGSKFIFTITALKGKEKLPAKLSSQIYKSTLRILAVDDSAETRDYFAHVMNTHNLACDVAADGPEALALMKSCEDKPYNIFFVDWQMPEMNGIELTRKIKALTDDNAVVIMISVTDWGSIEKEALAAGVKQFIPKPLFPSTLIDAINECLDPEPPKNSPCQEALNAARQGSFNRYTILIAEDVEINREIVAAVLEDSGVSIDFAENGKIAVSMFKNNPGKYSLILMDIHMPEMDGYEATRTIRALASPEAKNIPVIAMTANVFREDIDNCLAAGMNDHTGKPVDQDDLFAKLGKYLSDSPRDCV